MAELTVDGRKYRDVSFPYAVKVKRGFIESRVEAVAEGYEPVTLVIDKRFNTVSVLNMFGLLWWGVDAATGAMMKPRYDYYKLEFAPSDRAATDVR